MKEKFLPKLMKINPLKNGVPENIGNCQWCAIEGVRVLLQNAEPQKILGSVDGEMDPIEEYIDELYDYKTVHSKTRQQFYDSLNEHLAPGELMLVNVSGEGDHAYIIYREEDKFHLVDPDRNVFVELKSGNDFIQKVSGWVSDNLEQTAVTLLDYTNGNPNPKDKTADSVNMSINILNKELVKKNGLPLYGQFQQKKDDDEERSKNTCNIL